MDTTKLENLPNDGETVEKGAGHIVVELVEYEHGAVVNKTIMKKATGSINALAFAEGEGLNEKVSPFDTYAQIIDGSALINVDGKVTKLETGEGIIIPAHKSSHIDPNGHFKIILTVIKSGYE
jgi:quercetin dioxygenase-like cupin family protein